MGLAGGAGASVLEGISGFWDISRRGASICREASFRCCKGAFSAFRISRGLSPAGEARAGAGKGASFLPGGSSLKEGTEASCPGSEKIFLPDGASCFAGGKLLPLSGGIFLKDGTSPGEGERAGRIPFFETGVSCFASGELPFPPLEPSPKSSFFKKLFTACFPWSRRGSAASFALPPAALMAYCSGGLSCSREGPGAFERSREAPFWARPFPGAFPSFLWLLFFMCVSSSLKIECNFF